MGSRNAPAQRVATSNEGGWSFRAMGPRYVFGPDAPKWDTPDPNDAAAIVAGLPFDPMDPPAPPHDLARDWVSTSRWVISIAAAKTIAAEWDAEVRFADGHADAKRQAQEARPEVGARVPCRRRQGHGCIRSPHAGIRQAVPLFAIFRRKNEHERRRPRGR